MYKQVLCIIMNIFMGSSTSTILIAHILYSLLLADDRHRSLVVRKNMFSLLDTVRFTPDVSVSIEALMICPIQLYIDKYFGAFLPYHHPASSVLTILNRNGKKQHYIYILRTCFYVLTRYSVRVVCWFIEINVSELESSRLSSNRILLLEAFSIGHSPFRNMAKQLMAMNFRS